MKTKTLPALPPSLRRILLVVLPLMMLISCSVNAVRLFHLGELIKLSFLAWTLPASVVTYELVSTLVFFITPREYTDLRAAARRGFVIGIGMSLVFVIIYGLVDEGIIPNNPILRIVLDPIPTLVTAALLHMAVIVYYAAYAVAETNAAAQTIPQTLESAERLAEMVSEAAGLEDGMDRVTQPDNDSATIQIPDHPELIGKAVDVPENQVSRANEQLTIGLNQISGLHEMRDRPNIPRVSAENLEIARKIVAEWIASGNDLEKLMATEDVCQRFPNIGRRQVCNALRLAKMEAKGEVPVAA
mgnify:CR=1 FL=1